MICFASTLITLRLCAFDSVEHFFCSPKTRSFHGLVQYDVLHEGECERKKRLACADVADPHYCQRGAGCYVASNVYLGLIGFGMFWEKKPPKVHVLVTGLNYFNFTDGKLMSFA